MISPDVPADLAPLEAARRARCEGDRRSGTGGAFLKGRTIGVTGSNGKTTTTSLIGHILRSAGLDAQVGGNIGTPVTAMIESSREDGWNVLELSSFQLETICDFRAHMGLALNVTQNHLDRHRTFENYAAAKARLFRNMTAGDFADSERGRSRHGRLRQRDRGDGGMVQRHARSGARRVSCAAKSWCSMGSC